MLNRRAHPPTPSLQIFVTIKMFKINSFDSVLYYANLPHIVQSKSDAIRKWHRIFIHDT